MKRNINLNLDQDNENIKEMYSALPLVIIDEIELRQIKYLQN